MKGTSVGWTVAVSAGAVLIAVLVSAGWLLRRSNRKKLLAAPVPQSTIDTITKNVPLYRRMPAELKTRLGGLVQVFLAEKNFIACAGLELSDEIKTTIAAQACILLLGRRHNYFPRLKTIYVYPCSYVAKKTVNVGGVITEGPDERLGESWRNGPVVLAWDSVTGGARNITDGHNVVLHEFAHQLDQEDGSVDGAPLLDNVSCYRTWAHVLGAEYERLRRNKHGRNVIDSYGATNPAEFFAVATEAFFEKPRQLSRHSPELYEELKSYYKLDPLSWSENDNN